MKRRLSYPKDGDDKVRESNKQLRAQVKRLRKENDLLRQELENIEKPARLRRREEPVLDEPSEKYEDPVEKTQTKDEWRQDFVKRFKPKGGKK